jgi:hypothetical protein
MILAFSLLGLFEVGHAYLLEVGRVWPLNLVLLESFLNFFPFQGVYSWYKILFQIIDEILLFAQLLIKYPFLLLQLGDLFKPFLFEYDGQSF